MKEQSLDRFPGDISLLPCHFLLLLSSLIFLPRRIVCRRLQGGETGGFDGVLRRTPFGGGGNAPRRSGYAWPLVRPLVGLLSFHARRPAPRAGAGNTGAES